MVGSQKKTRFVQNEAGFMCEIGCGDGTRVIRLFARVIQQLPLVGFKTQKIEASVDCCYVWRFDRPWTQASKPALTDSSLAAKKHTEALHVAFFSNQASEPTTTMTYHCCCCCCCGVLLYDTYVAIKDARCPLLFLGSMCEPASADNYL